MSKMLEQVALAIWSAREMQSPEGTSRMTPDHIDKATVDWSSAMELARVAIEAMQEANRYHD